MDDHGVGDSVLLASSELDDANLLRWSDSDMRRFSSAGAAVRHYWNRDHGRLDDMLHETRLTPIWISETDDPFTLLPLQGPGGAKLLHGTELFALAILVHDFLRFRYGSRFTPSPKKTWL